MARSGNFILKSSLEPSSRALREIQPGDVDPATLVFGPQASGTASPDTTAASAWPGGWWRQGASLAVQRKGRWRQGDMVSRYPGARRSGRPSSG